MDRETAKVARAFVRKLKTKFKLNQVILFGSRARGNNWKTSDYDFIIVSESFAGKKFPERMAEIYDSWDAPQDIEPLCYTPEEFERRKRELGLVAVAVKEGKRVC